MALAATSSVAALLAGRPIALALALGCANAVGAAVVIWVLGRRRSGRLRLHTQEDLWRLLFATLWGGAVVGAPITLTLAVLTGCGTYARFREP